MAIVGLLAIVGSLLCAGIASAESTPEGTTVLGVRAGQACLKEQIRITGFALAREESGASLALDGYRISQILVSEGDRVASGQELLRATLIGAEDGAGQGRPASVSARAPIAGLVTRINARIGMATSATMPVGPGGQPEPQLRIASETGIDLLVDVPSLYATKIRVGTTARIIRGDGGEATGTVRVAVSEVDPTTQLGRARLTVEPASALRSGQFASAVIETARDCGLSVPRSAVLFQNGVTSVQVLNGSKVETRRVRTGLSDDTNIQIRDGLVEGEAVVADAGAAVRPGDRVTPVLTNRDGSRNR
ncbi:secretion protein HylD [Methylobacterium sp. J-078]|uniref:efflux RND transporter periplasmic adaptor subunit n=1 Tax=Methylobacterium sp. J-078 TaxID=2836657 RepID=UPI001FBAA7AE|nr:secretion protein HylD [Methylobacterium sp. J-078]MCJ2043892.1 secretion protein HylD [Methylobacterium sp. J-078]